MYNRFEPEVTSELMTPEARRMLENYLQRACSAEEAVVDPQEQAELRAEMSGHILALAMAHQELGASPEEAMRAALKQFGSHPGMDTPGWSGSAQMARSGRRHRRLRRRTDQPLVPMRPKYTVSP